MKALSNFPRGNLSMRIWFRFLRHALRLSASCGEADPHRHSAFEPARRFDTGNHAFAAEPPPADIDVAPAPR
jgi:hypothetical protein